MTALDTGVHEVRDGVRLLRPDPDIPYRDGAEERVLEIVEAAADLSSDGTELLEAAQTWPERYHTHPARANVLRALDIPADAAVLEIGAGCGPITRYLGETGARVDSVEPVLSRARVGRARTRDLPGVQVFCGNLEDVPPEPVYDLVVVVGVLEYVGGGEPDPEPYLAFLAECRRRLKPGGTLALAIENKLGVKYLTGTAEDHSGRMFDSIEDYPRGTPARTFSATALLDLLRASDFRPRLLGVFPDYKHTRVVFDTDELHRVAPDLVENLPSFPSRFAGTRSLKLASEQRVWRELVRDGLAAHFSNSFLVLGSTDGDPDDSPDGTPDGVEGHGSVDLATRLWPQGRLARYFSINRRRAYVATTTVSRDPAAEGAVTFDRTYSPDQGPLIVGGTTAWSYVAGASFLEAYAAADDEGRRRLLTAWLQLVAELATGERVPLDAIPSNVIVTSGSVTSGSLTSGSADAGSGLRLELIDSEFHDRAPVERVIDRGLFWTAVHLGRTTPPELWAPAKTIGAVMHHIAELAGIELDPARVDRLLRSEAAFQVAVSTHYLGPDAQRDAVEGLRGIHDTLLWHTPLGRRLHHDHDDAIAARDRLQIKLERADEEQQDLRRRLKKAKAGQRRLRTRLRTSKRRVRDLRRKTKQARTARTTAADAGGLLAAVRRQARRLRPERD